MSVPIHARSRAPIARLVAALALLVPLMLVVSPPALADTEHCAGHRDEAKVEADESPGTVEVVDTRTGDTIEVIVTISDTGMSIEPVDPSIELEDADWCIKSSTGTNSGQGLSGTSSSTNHHGIVQDVSYIVLYSVTSVDDDVQQCDATTNSGGAGVTETVHELGKAGVTAFLFEWEAYSVPDQFEVLYEGNVIYDTGVVGDAINEGTGSDTVDVPAGTSTTVTVRVTGPSGTAWQYRVNCP